MIDDSFNSYQTVKRDDVSCLSEALKQNLLTKEEIRFTLFFKFNRGNPMVILLLLVNNSQD